MRSEIKNDNISGAYILYGDEDYLKLGVLKEIRRKLLPCGTADLNYLRFDMDNYSAEALANAAENLPCFGDKKLIEVYELDFCSLNDASQKELAGILQGLEYYDYCTVVFFCRSFEFDEGKTRNRALVPSKLYKNFDKCSKLVKFDYESDAKLINWLARHFAAEKLEASQDSLRHIIGLCGTDMFTLSNEVAKLAAYMKFNGIPSLDKETVDKVVIQKKEFGTFAFANAVLSGDIDTATAVLKKMKENREKPEYILSSLSSAFQNMCRVRSLLDAGKSESEIASKLKMHSYTVGLYVKAVSNKSMKKITKLTQRCYEADISLKSSPLDSEYILDKLLASTVGL